MKKLLFVTLMLAMLITYSFGISACTKDTNSFENIPIRVTGSWGYNKEGFLCIYLHIANNSDKTIRDVQGMYFHSDYDRDGNVISGFPGYRSAGSLYLYDDEGNDIHNRPKKNIKPGETLTLILGKFPRSFMTEAYEARIYITWIDFVLADNWGTKDLKGDESYIAIKAPLVYVEPMI